MKTWNFMTYVVEYNNKSFNVLFNGAIHATITPTNQDEYKRLSERFNSSEGVNGLVSDDNKLIYIN